VLATVPVLVPLLVTGGEPAPAAAPPPPVAASDPLSRPAPAAPPPSRASRDTSRSPLPPAPSAGAVLPTPTPTPTPSAPPAPPSAAPTTPATPTPTADPTTPAAPLVAAPDLVVTAVGWSPEDPAAGTAVTFTATIRNAGSEPTPAGTAVVVSFAVDGTVVSWTGGDTSQLLPGESRTVTATAGTAGATWTAVPGDHQVVARADSEGAVAEGDEDDNTGAADLKVG
jgi:hypothetical protein